MRVFPGSFGKRQRNYCEINQLDFLSDADAFKLCDLHTEGQEGLKEANVSPGYVCKCRLLEGLVNEYSRRSLLPKG